MPGFEILGSRLCIPYSLSEIFPDLTESEDSKNFTLQKTSKNFCYAVYGIAMQMLVHPSGMIFLSNMSVWSRHCT